MAQAMCKASFFFTFLSMIPFADLMISSETSISITASLRHSEIMFFVHHMEVGCLYRYPRHQFCAWILFVVVSKKKRTSTIIRNHVQNSLFYLCAKFLSQKDCHYEFQRMEKQLARNICLYNVASNLANL